MRKQKEERVHEMVKGGRCCSAGQMRKNTEGASGKREGGVETIKEKKRKKKEAADGRIRSCMYLVSLHLRLLSQPDSSGLRAVGEQIAQGILDQKTLKQCSGFK